MAEGKTLPTTRHSSNAFSGPRLSWMFELVEASKMGKSGKFFGFVIGGPTDELHPFTKRSAAGFRLITVLIALLRFVHQISHVHVLGG